MARRRDQTIRGMLQPACWVVSDRNLYSTAAQSLEISEESVKRAVTELGRGRMGGWRSQEKAAALAGWLVLAKS